jgi:hypothetical protein
MYAFLQLNCQKQLGVLGRAGILASSKDVTSSLVPQINPRLHATHAFTGSSHYISKFMS